MNKKLKNVIRKKSLLGFMTTLLLTLHHNARAKELCDNRKKFQFVINDFVVREHDVNAECEINGLLQNFILK